MFNEEWRYQFTLANKFLPSGAHLGGPWPPRWAPEGREVSHWVVVIDRFHCNMLSTSKRGKQWNVSHGMSTVAVSLLDHILLIYHQNVDLRDAFTKYNIFIIYKLNNFLSAGSWNPVCLQFYVVQRKRQEKVNILASVEIRLMFTLLRTHLSVLKTCKINQY